jgi:hypothetical protein
VLLVAVGAGYWSRSSRNSRSRWQLAHISVAPAVTSCFSAAMDLARRSYGRCWRIADHRRWMLPGDLGEHQKFFLSLDFRPAWVSPTRLQCGWARWVHRVGTCRVGEKNNSFLAEMLPKL